MRVSPAVNGLRPSIESEDTARKYWLMSAAVMASVDWATATTGEAAVVAVGLVDWQLNKARAAILAGSSRKAAVVTREGIKDT